jgi:hypothetical protein
VGKILTERRHDWMYFCEPEENVGGAESSARAAKSSRIIVDEGNGLCAWKSWRL